MEKLYTSIMFLKMAGRRMHTPHPTLLDPHLAIHYRNHQRFAEEVYISASAGGRHKMVSIKGISDYLSSICF